MSIQSYLENVRAKPETVRRRTAFWWSLGITALIAAFYVGSITGVNVKSGAAIASAAGRAGSPADSIVAGAGAMVNDIWNMLVEPRKVVYSQVRAVPGVR